MSILFMMPNWEDTSGGWMRQMMHNISDEIGAVAVNDAMGNKYWQNTKPVFSLSPPCKNIRFISGLFKKLGLSMTIARLKPDQNLIAAIEQSHISSVFCQYGTYAADFMPVWRKTEIPLFIHFHGYDATFDLRTHQDPQKKRFPPSYKENILELNQRATFIANSRFTHKMLTDVGIDADRIVIKFFGVPLAKETHNYHNNQRIKILHLGNLVDFKSPDRTILAFELAKSRGLDAELIIAGDGWLRTTCELLRKRSPYKESIHLLGRVPWVDAKKLLSEADIFTAHNIKGELTGQSECFGVSIIEAMAHGLPAVSTKHGGVLETVVDGETGILIEPGDITGQANAFLKLSQNADLRQALGIAGRQRVSECFSPAQEKSTLSEIFSNNKSLIAEISSKQ